MDKVLTERQRNALRRALAGRLVVLCFGAGVDSTGLMVALQAAGLRPDLVSMADVGDEKPGTWQHVERMGEVLRAWGWPAVTVCRKVPLAAIAVCLAVGQLLEERDPAQLGVRHEVVQP